MKKSRILLTLALAVFLVLTISSVDAVNIRFWDDLTAWFNETGDMNISGKMFCENCIDSEDIEDGTIHPIDVSSEFNKTYRTLTNYTFEGAVNITVNASIGIVMINDTGIFFPSGRYIIDNGTGIVIQG